MGYVNTWSDIGLLNVASTLKFWLPNTKVSVIPKYFQKLLCYEKISC